MNPPKKYNNNSVSYNHDMNRPNNGNWNSGFPNNINQNQYLQMMENQRFNNNNNSMPENMYPYMDFAMQPQFEPPMLPPSQQTVPPPSQQHQQFQMNSPSINGMLTPFDTAYGATLLPSHLLMGSPFISSPNMHTPQQNSQATFGRQRNSNGHGPLLHNNISNNNMGAQRSYNNNNNNNNNNPYRNHSSNDTIDFTKETVSKMNSLFNEPFEVSYKVLPKGDDAYRTRSLLLENIDKSISIHDFITRFVKATEIESIYVISKDDSKQNILLSFISVEICLNFYNNVLQRLKEFKLGLKSEDMNLNFILLKYVEHQNHKEEDNNELDDKSMLRYDLTMNHATRSIVVELKDSYEVNKLNSLLKNLKLVKSHELNKRYIMESVYLFNTEKSNKLFNKNYMVLTFLNIRMAIEMINYIRYKGDKLNLGKCFFVNISSTTKKAGGEFDNQDVAISTNNSMTSLTNQSSMSLLSSRSSLNLNHSVDDIMELLQNIDLDDNLLNISVESYPEPSIEVFNEHQPFVTKAYSQSSNMGRSNSVISTPRPLDRNYNETSVFGPVDNNGYTPQNTMLIPQTPMGMNNPSFYMEQPPFKYSKNFPQPITDTLEDQMNTTAKVASAMGTDATNRTIYIGNINPRSKAEDICNVVRGGILQSIKFIESKHICFITFIEASAAVQFYANIFIDPIVLHGNTLKIGWGNYPGPLTKSVALAVTVGASRNVYVSLPEVAFKDKFINDPEFEQYHNQYSLPSEEQLRKDFNSYGSIEQINYLSDSHCCWVNFMNINSAIKLVEDASNRPEQFSEAFSKRYDGLIINYGKDRCGNMNRNLASKNARYNKKMKKTNVRNNNLNYLEEKRRHQEITRKSFSNSTYRENRDFSSYHENDTQFENNNDDTKKFAPLDSLGISIETSDNIQQLSPIIDRNEEEEEEEAEDDNDAIIEKSPIDDSSDTEDNEMEKDTTVNVISETSSDSDITQNGDKTFTSDEAIPRGFTNNMESGLGITTGISNSSSSSPPEAPKSHITNTNAHLNHHKGGKNSGPNNSTKNTRAIPGSDVMAQYLAQLQHSTFIYAANVLGASNDQAELYSQDE
ncbi:RNA-binding protein Nab6p [Monosporozyma servazzii]